MIHKCKAVFDGKRQKLCMDMTVVQKAEVKVKAIKIIPTLKSNVCCKSIVKCKQTLE